MQYLQRTSAAIFSRCRIPQTTAVRDLSAVNVQQPHDDLDHGSVSASPLPQNAQVVVCGGGIMGSSVAYHLAQSGITDVVIVEQGRLGGGSTWLSTGLVSEARMSGVETKICQHSHDLYKQLHSQGHDIGYRQCGSINLAASFDRLHAMRRLHSLSKYHTIRCELLTPDDIYDLCPLLNVEDLQGGLWVPNDAVIDTYLTCLVLAMEAAAKGVFISEQNAVEEILCRDGAISSVVTKHGTICCDYFVNCAGVWSRHIGQLSKPQVMVPLQPCTHHHLHTRPLLNLNANMPVIRDPDGFINLRVKDQRIVTGGFEPVGRPAFLNQRAFTSQDCLMPEDWDHFHILLDNLLHRIPSLKSAQPEVLHNCAEAFSPDSKWIVGEVTEIRNYLVASGLKTQSAVAAGGLGRLVAHWIRTGTPSMDFCDVDVQRFIGLHNNRRFLLDRVVEVPALHYKLMYPFYEFSTGRNLRMSPIFPRLKAAGAVFNQTMGYERSAYFDPRTVNQNQTAPCIATTNTFRKPHWFDYVREEYHACREGVALLDYSSFAKIDLQSPGTEVVSYLQYLCSNDIDIPVGSIAHTGLQNKHGGYENDCSLCRLAVNRYIMISPTIQQARSMAWLRRHLPSNSPITLTDVTSMYTAICVLGAHARDLLAEVCDSDMSPSNFPFFTFKYLNVGLTSNICVMNLTHTGEIGWILYVPNENALHTYERLMSTGAKYGIQLAGAYAMRTLRIEKFYAFWGQDLDTFTTPLECGRAFRVKFNKGEFIGRETLLKQQEEGVYRKYIQLLVEGHDTDRDPWPWGGEPIFRNGECVGTTTTTCYGYTLNKQVCLGFIENRSAIGERHIVSNEFCTKGKFEVDIAGHRFPAKVNLHSPKLPSPKGEPLLQERYMATRNTVT